MEELNAVIQQLGEAYVILQDIEVRGRYAEELVVSQQKIEQSINQINVFRENNKVGK